MSRRGENIYKRTDGRYEGRYIIGRREDGKAKYGYLYSRQYSDIKRKMAEMRLLYTAEDRQCRPATPTFRAWAAEWENSPAYQRLKLSTRQKYSQNLKKRLIPFFGAIQIGDIDGKMLQEFADRMTAEGLAASTVREMIQLLKTLLREAARRQILPRIPECRLMLADARPREKEILSREEQRKLQQYAGEEDLPVIVSLYTGLRLGEICALQWSDIDRDHQTLTVSRTVQRLYAPDGETKTALVVGPPKTQTSLRTIPLPENLLQALEQRAGDGRPRGYIFGNGTQPADPRRIQNGFHRLLKRAGLPPMGFHSLRHTFTTRLLEMGEDLKTISSLLGHSNVTTTMNIYAHSRMETKRSAVRRLMKDLYET